LFERFCRVAGMVSLTTFGLAACVSNQARDEAPPVGPARESEPSTPDPAGEFRWSEVPDQSLWSPERVLAYFEGIAASNEVPSAVLRMPALGLAVPVYEGATDLNLNRGAGQIDGTATPGEGGNVGIAAHRDGFFRVLKDAAVGQELILELPTATRRYRVADLRIVEPTDVHVLDATEDATVTLVTCYPFYFVGHAPQRFIVRAVAEDRFDPTTEAVNRTVTR
jgi:sortase A